jgi:large subunit ribosomal protein L24
MGFGIKKGDTVVVLTGKDRGVRGRVLHVVPTKDRILVENVNFVKRHERKKRTRVESGGIMQKEAPVHISNVMLVCPKCNEPTRLGTRVTEEGAKSRICKKCGAAV